MTPPTFLKISLVVVVVLSLGFIIWGLSQKKPSSSSFVKKKASHSASIKEETSVYPVIIKGLAYETHYGSKLLSKVEIDEFKVNPRKMGGIFNVKSFNELTLTDIKLKTYLYPEASQNTPPSSNIAPFSFCEELLPNNSKDTQNIGLIIDKTGLITRGVIKNLIWEIYRSEEIFMRIEAKEGYINFNKEQTRLKCISIEDIPAGKLTKSDLAIWDDRENVFNLPEEYIMLSPEGRITGKGITIDLGFNSRS